MSAQCFIYRKKRRTRLFLKTSCCVIDSLSRYTKSCHFRRPDRPHSPPRHKWPVNGSKLSRSKILKRNAKNAKWTTAAPFGRVDRATETKTECGTALLPGAIGAPCHGAAGVTDETIHARYFKTFKKWVLGTVLQQNEIDNS